MRRILLLLTFTILVGLSVPATGKSVRIGFLATYTPWIAAMADGTFETTTGYKIKWQEYGTGAEILNAINAGKLDIGSAGSPPIAAGLSLGYDIELFWILQNINFAEGLVIRNASRIVEPQHLRGKRIAVPFASTTHYHLLFALRQFQIDVSEVQLIFRTPDEALEEWQSDRIDAAFIWNPVLDRMLRNGWIMLTSGRLSRWGKPTFDGLVADRSWAVKNTDFMVEFVKTIALQDLDFRSRPKSWNRKSSNVQKIAKMLGGTPYSTAKSLRLYRYPEIRVQASPKWLGGGENSGAARAIADTATFLHRNGVIRKDLKSYASGVTDRWVKEAMAQLP